MAGQSPASAYATVYKVDAYKLVSHSVSMAAKPFILPVNGDWARNWSLLIIQITPPGTI
jgi:hypothetical protein